ncbi:MAG: membrane dipeptidase [Nitrospinota bacterium]
MMSISYSDIWDFHTDLRLIQRLPPDREYLQEQMDIPAAGRLGGLFTATGRFADLPDKEQLARLEEEVNLIAGASGLDLVLAAKDSEGTGNQLLHAEGIYFIQNEEDIELIDRLWGLGFRSLAPMYNADNALGGGAEGEPSRGLTRLGRAFAMGAWARGFLVDCAHANHTTKGDLIDLALVTGSALHYSHGHLDEPVDKSFKERGLPREAVERLLETGGLIGLSPHPGFLGSFERYLEEIEFIAGIAPSQVVLGTDFAGTNRPGPDGNRIFEEFRGVWGLPSFSGYLRKSLGKDFTQAYLGGTLKTYLKGALS